MAGPLVRSATVLDAGVLIGYVQSNDVHHSTAVRALATLADAGEDLVLSTVTFTEIMTGGVRRGPAAVRYLLAAVEGLPRIQFVAPERQIALAAAYFRSDHPQLGLADSMVVATAEAVGAQRILTTDRDFDAIDRSMLLEDFVV